MFIFTPTEVSIDQFILFWFQQYHDEIEDSHYTKIIQLRPFTVEQMQKLFRWKGGARLQQKTVKLVEKKYLPHIEAINSLPLDYPASKFLEDFTGTGAVWGIFLLHCWQPNEYPIYDQNVHRAMTYIRKEKCENIEAWGDDRMKEAYFNGETLIRRRIDGPERLRAAN